MRAQTGVKLVVNYCHWGPNGDAASSTCNVEETGIQSTEYCNANEAQCQGCGGRWCTNGNSCPSNPTVLASIFLPDPPAPSVTPAPVPPVMSVATTTRYWDCSGGACGCAYLPFGPGSDDLPAHCYSNAMFAAPRGNPYSASFYGAAAVSQALGGGDWLAEGCGKCWKVIGTSNISPFDGVSTVLVLKATNYCPPLNPMCANGNPHFDIAAPGFDNQPASLSNSCLIREENEIDGFTSCEQWMIASGNPNENCDCSLFNSNVLRDGCENFRTLYWDNVQVSYEEVTCPRELTRLPCWVENGGCYPDGIPTFCASNVGSGPSPTNASPTPGPTPAPTPTP